MGLCFVALAHIFSTILTLSLECLNFQCCIPDLANLCYFVIQPESIRLHHDPAHRDERAATAARVGFVHRDVLDGEGHNGLDGNRRRGILGE